MDILLYREAQMYTQMCTFIVIHYLDSYVKSCKVWVCWGFFLFETLIEMCSFCKSSKVKGQSGTHTHTFINPYAHISICDINHNCSEFEFQPFYLLRIARLFDSGNFLLCVLKIHLKVFLLGVLTSKDWTKYLFKFFHLLSLFFHFSVYDLAT